MPVDPARLSIVHYPDPILRTRCRPVPEVNDEVRAVGVRMIELMEEARGLGLAAPQVGLPWRMFVCHVPAEEDDGRGEPVRPGVLRGTEAPTVYINPVLTEPVNPVEASNEGCLSLPDINGDIPRPRGITITALDLWGEAFTQTATGLLARCWQHETDHLDGVLILDRMSQLSRLRVRSAVRGLEKAAGIR